MAITATDFFAIAPGDLTAETEDRFFTDLKTRNKTFKRTSSNRFDSVDRCCLDAFRRNSAVIGEVLDVGISSGTTTLALHTALHSAGFAARVTGTDLSLTGFLVPVRPGLRVLVDEQGHPLQYELFGRAVRAWGRRADYVSGMGILRWALHAVSHKAIARQLAAGGSELRTVRLVSPRIAGTPGLEIEANDVFEPTERFVGRFDFVRAANILNLGYFDEPKLTCALGNVVSYLTGPGAWLLIARTVGTRTAGTLFRVAADGRRMVVAERIGSGSEIEALVLSLVLTPVSGATA